MVDFEEIQEGMKLRLVSSKDNYILVKVTGKGIKEVDGIKTPLIHSVVISHPQITLSKDPSCYDYHSINVQENNINARRRAHCFGCGIQDLDSLEMSVCNDCGWIICPTCGSCKCTYKGIY